MAEAEQPRYGSKRTIEGNPPCKYFTPHNGCYYNFHAFEYGKACEGYWNGDKILEQVLEVVDVFNFLHPDDQALFIFNWSCGNSKYPPDAWNANDINMNKTGGGGGVCVQNMCY